MSGLPTLTVELDDGTGTFPHDVTAYVRLREGWSFSRGRQDENDGIDSGVANLVLVNADGRFTLGNPTYDVDLDQRIRFTETVGGVDYVRFTGHVQDFPLEWRSGLGNVADARISAADWSTRLARRKLRSAIDQEIALFATPTSHYPLDEAVGASAAGDIAGSGANPLLPTGSGTAVTFGATGPGFEEQTAATFTAGQYLAANGAYVGATSGAFGIIVFFEDSGSGTLVKLRSGTGRSSQVFTISLAGSSVSASNGIGGSLNSSIGTSSGWRVARLTYDGSNLLALSVSGGTSDVTAIGAQTWDDLTLLEVGNGFTGDIAHVATYSGAGTGGTFADLASTISDGFATETSDERIARLASYVGIATGDQNLEAGKATIPATTLAGSSPIEAMRAIEQAEGGALFIAGDGVLTFQNRTHRVQSATGTAAITLSAADAEAVRFGGAREYLVNTATGARPGGAGQRVVDAASVASYEEYPADLSGLLVATDADVLDRLNYEVGAHKTPLPRVREVELDLLTLPEATVKDLLTLELGDLITITDLPTQAPTTPIDLIVEGIKEEQGPDEWTLTLNTVPASLYRVWILGDSTYGVLGSTTRLHY